MVRGDPEAFVFRERMIFHDQGVNRFTSVSLRSTRSFRVKGILPDKKIGFSSP